MSLADLRDPTLTIEEFSILAARLGVKKMLFKRLLFARAERAYFGEAYRLTGTNTHAGRRIGLSRTNFVTSKKRGKLRAAALGI